jgi:hypothetical protein
MNDLNGLLQLLMEAKARTVSGAFERFLDKEINISKGIRGLASTSQNHLRDFLATERHRDATFPRVLSIADRDFIGGSFARHTKNWPLDDIDIYLPLDGHDLVYQQSWLRLPYTVVSDGVLTANPLLNSRWMNSFSISSRKLIHEFAAVLRRHYPQETRVTPNGEAVSIRMSHGATKSGDGLGYDVVPCFSLKPDDPDDLSFYLIPDGHDGWLRTNPRIDAYISGKIQADNFKTFRKAVKLVKYWNTETLSGALGSYYIELALARAFLERNNKGEYIQSISFGVALGLWAVQQALEKGNQHAWIPHAPPVEPGSVNPVERLLLSYAALAAGSAWEQEKAGKETKAIQTWGQIFGASFLAS